MIYVLGTKIRIKVPVQGPLEMIIPTVVSLWPTSPAPGSTWQFWQAGRIYFTCLCDMPPPWCASQNKISRTKGTRDPQIIGGKATVKRIPQKETGYC